MTGGQTVPIQHLSPPRCGTCRAHTFLKAERFPHSDEVQVTAVCDHGSGNFCEDHRIFQGATWDREGSDLARRSFISRAPFSAQPTIAKQAVTRADCPAEQTKKATGTWWRRVDKLAIGDIVRGPIADLRATHVASGITVVIISTTKGATDYRVRYRTAGVGRYGTFTCVGSIECPYVGNEYQDPDIVKAIDAIAHDECTCGHCEPGNGPCQGRGPSDPIRAPSIA